MSQTTTDPAQTNSRPQPSAAVPAGWYPDPQGSAQRRWWNGSAWTHALEPLEPEPVATAPAAPWANLPGPSVRSPSSAAPTVHRALAADPAESAAAFPTRRQLREQEAEAARAAEFAASFATPAAEQTPVAATPTTAAPTTATSTTAGPAASPTPEPAPRAAIPPRPARPERESTVFVMGPVEPMAAAEPKEPAAQTLPEPVSAPAAAAQQEAPSPEPAVAETALPVPVAAGSTPSAGGKPTVVASDYGHAQTGSAQAGSAQAGPAQAGPARARTAPAGSRTESTFPLDLAPASAAAGATPTASTLPRSVATYTAEVWLIAALPVVALAAAWALATYAAEQYTLGLQGGIAALLLLGSLVLAMRDRRELAFGHHARTASPLWALLTPVAYLAARAISTRRETGRGWAPLVVLLLVGAGIAAGAYFTPLSLAPVLSGLGAL